MFLFLLCGLSGYSVNYKFRYYTVDEGLTSNTIRCVLQDRTGYIWVGTSGGLNRFSASQFKTFKHEPGNRYSIGSNQVWSLCEDSEGKLWVGGKGDICVYDPGTEHFETFNTGGLLNSTTLVCSIAEDKVGNIWIGTVGDGVFRYNRAENSLVQYTKPAVFQGRGLVSNSIIKIFVDHQGVVWVLADEHTSLNFFNQEMNDFESMELVDTISGRGLDEAFDMCEDSQKNIWITGTNSHLLKLNKERTYFTSIKPTDNKYMASRVRCIMEYKPGVFMLGTNAGILIYDALHYRFDKISCNRNDPYGLSDYFVHDLFRDREGGIWAGTFFGGLNYLSPTSFCFELHQESPEGGVAEHFIVSKFCEDEQKNIWIGSDNGGLGKFVPQTGAFEYVLVDKRKPALNIHALYADKSNLWIGTFKQGLYRMNRFTGEKKWYNIFNGITSLYEDREGTLWMGTTMGVMVYNKTADRFDSIIYAGLNCNVTDILEDQEKNIWFASNGGGLIAYNTLNKSISRYSCDEKDPESMTTGVKALCFHRDRLWVGTAYGLCYFDPEQKKIVKSDMTKEYPLLSIYCIIAHDDYLWMTTDGGLVKYGIESGKTTWYTKEDGLQGKLFNPNAGLKSLSGNIYIGGSNGFNIFNPDQVFENTYSPGVVFTDFKLFNESVAIDSVGILQKHINVQRAVVLNAKQNVFTIDFTTLSFCAPSKIDYQYKLDGFDKEWIQIVDNQVSSVSYTNLSAGHYTFKIKACSNDGSWSPETAEISVTILPPWWNTVWMKLVYGLLLMGGIAISFVVFKRKIQKRQMIQFRELQQKSEQEVLESKIRIFQEIAHEIRTPVTLISAPVEEMLKFPNLQHRVKEDLEVVKKNSDRLIELMNQVLDFSQTGSEYSQIRNRQIEVCEYLAIIVERFIGTAKSKGVDIQLNIPDEKTIFAWMDVEAFDKVVSNLLINALKYTKDRIEVTLTRSDVDDLFFTLVIRDNGMGIEDEQKMFELFYSSSMPNNIEQKGFGIGLAVVNLLLKKMGASVQVESKQDEGAVFYLQFPLNIVPENEEDVSSVSKKTVDLTDETEIGKSGKNERAVVLVVEDNEALRNFLAKSLQAFYEVRTAANGKEAVVLLENPDIDIIISDIVMPVMDGWDLCNYIKTNVGISHIPIILLTARTDVESKIKALENGADVYIEKPVVMEYLYAQIAGILNKRRLLRATFSQEPLTPLQSIAGNKQEEEFLMKVNEIVEQNISNSEFSMDDIADSLCMSRSVMYGKIKAISGLTPNDFVRLVRLRKAAELFNSGENYKINEVCYLVGFSSPSYFSKCFQQQFGMLPRDFINTCK